ncbi:MAG: DUF4037 domain-containing protein [Lachnospiraceae bacterium]|nr:DUF4037 domain-containing protein [Lachnospiraceae bacterium]
MASEASKEKGLEISKKYYELYGKAMIKEKFPDIEEKIAIGLAGSGSECFGYDDGYSHDHDFEPAFCIFLPQEDIIDSKTAFNLQREYTKLPQEFMGLKRQKMSPVGGNRHGVIRTSDFFTSKCGNPFGQLTVGEWLTVPEYSLAEAVNGEIFKDNYGEFSLIRDRISHYPNDIRLKKIAGYLLIMAQAGQYNYLRCVDRGESAAAQISVYKFTEACMHVIFLLNEKYMPYYKWSFRALKDLSRLGNLYDSLEFIISSDNEKNRAQMKSEMIEDIAALIIKELKNDSMTEAVCNDLEKHAYSVNDHIKDGNLRNMDIFSGV